MNGCARSAVSSKLLCCLLFAMLACTTGMLAQDFRGSITGTVTDSTGAVVPGAKVTLTNTETGVASAAASNGSGSYAYLYVVPGNYRLQVESAGFAKWERKAVELHVNEQLKINAELRVGNGAEMVTVEATAPVLEAANADVGQLYESKDIEELPLPDGNAITMARLTSGAVLTGDPKFTRPFDNSAISSVRVNGAEGGNSFSLNGIPNNGLQIDNGNSVVAYVPPADAVKEFKMSTSWFSAAQGNSASSNINLDTKSGTNQFHGSAYEYFQNEALDATPWLVNHSGQKKSVTRSNHFGGTFGGPVLIPHVYDGHQKTFFFVMAEGVLDKFPEPGTRLVPTAKMRNGDLSEFCTSGFNSSGLCINGNQQMYNPFTAVSNGSGGKVLRQPFLYNKIPINLLNPITQKYLEYYPLPNITTDDITKDNYFSSNPRTDSFHSWMARVDHVLTSRQRLAFNYFTNWRQEARGVWTGTMNGINPVGNHLTFINHGVGITDTITLSTTTLLDIKLGFNRFEDSRIAASKGYNPAQLGFSSSVTSLFRGVSYLPRFDIADFDNLSQQQPQIAASNYYSLAPTITKMMGSHILSVGYDGRMYRFNWNSSGNGMGQYSFDGDYARKTEGGTKQFGMGMVDFLVGQPTSGSIDRNSSRANQSFYHSAFVQDDWKVTRKLTLNLGIRYEYEGAPNERYNRNVRGFDFTTPAPFQAAAQAAFAQMYPNGLSVLGHSAITAINAVGSYNWANDKNRGLWNPNPWNFMPRFGAAYAVDDKTVVRLGWAIYSLPFVSHYSGVAGNNQAGFSQSTPLNPSNDNGLTFLANLENPFPYGVMDPAGSSRGAYQNAGGNVSFFFPTDVKTPHVQRWSFEVQRSLPGNWTIDAIYNGSHGTNLDRSSWIFDTVSSEYYSTLPTRDQATYDALTKKVPNPFKGLFGTAAQNSTSLNTASTIAAYQLLRPYPQFTGINSVLFNGSSHYEGAQLKVTHRFKKGYSVNGIYTWSKLLERYGFSNEFQYLPNKQLSGADIPHRVVVTFIGEVPFGRGRRWGRNLPGYLEAIAGGWQMQGVYQAQSGDPIDFGNRAYFGDPKKLKFDYKKELVGTGTPLIDVSGFYLPTDANGNPWSSASAMRTDPRISLTYNVRNFPTNMGNTRNPGQNNVDLSVTKKFRLREGMTLETRGEFLNAFNHPWWTDPYTDPTKATFGTLDGNQRNLPRNIQITMRLVF